MAGRVFIIEDDAAMAYSLRRLLAHEGYFVARAGTAEDGCAAIVADGGFDILLLDVNLPGADGFSCCRQLRELGWRKPIIMLTARSHPQDRISGLDLGADDYLGKPFEPDELLARIKAQLRRSVDYSRAEEFSTVLPVAGDRLGLDLVNRDALVNGVRAGLTPHEYSLLEVLSRHSGEPLSKNWLFQELWGCAPEAGSKVLAVTVRRLRQKIEENADDPQFVQTIRGFGYILKSNQEEL